MTQRPAPHPWIAALRVGLDGLEKALLQGDAAAVERASQHVQTVLKRAPRTADFGVPGSTLREDMLNAAQRFGQLRQGRAARPGPVRTLGAQPAAATSTRNLWPPGRTTVLDRRRRQGLPVGLSALLFSLPPKETGSAGFLLGVLHPKAKRSHDFSDGACMCVPK
jgi:hypothetical protein